MVADGNGPNENTEFGSSRSRLDETEPPLGSVSDYLSEARVQATRYLSAQADRLKALVRSVVLFGLLGVASAVVGLTVVICATVLACVGLAGAIGQLLGGRQWAGDLITGGGVLTVLGIGGFVFINRLIKSARRATIANYEKRRSGGPMS